MSNHYGLFRQREETFRTTTNACRRVNKNSNQIQWIENLFSAFFGCRDFLLLLLISVEIGKHRFYRSVLDEERCVSVCVCACHSFFQLISIVLCTYMTGMCLSRSLLWMYVLLAKNSNAMNVDIHKKNRTGENKAKRRRRRRIKRSTTSKTAGDWNSWIMLHDILWRSFHYCDIDIHIRSFARSFAWFALISLLHHITSHLPSSKIIMQQ